MLNCKQASELMSQAMDAKLPMGKRLSLRLHVLMCRGCNNFSHQISFLRKAAKHLDGYGESNVPHLSKEVRNRIATAWREIQAPKGESD